MRHPAKARFIGNPEDYDCYFYSADYFEVVSDPYGLLDKASGQYIYDWSLLFYD